MENNAVTPPRAAQRLLRFYCTPELVEELEGDLLELFIKRRQNLGVTKARLLYWRDVFALIRPFTLRRKKNQYTTNSAAMFSHYVKIGYRSFVKRKFYTLLNAIGLAVGLTFSLMIGIFIYGEVGVNKDLKDSDKIYIVQSKWKGENMGHPLLTPAPIAKAIKEEYPELVQNYFRMRERNATVRKDDRIFREDLLIVDSTFIDMFGFDILQGDGKTGLLQPRSVMITRKGAMKYFGRVDVLNETLTLMTETAGGLKQDYVITAVLEDLPRNSVSNLVGMDAQIFIPLTQENVGYFGGGDPDSWQDVTVSYIKLTENAVVEDTAKAFTQLLSLHAPDNVKQFDTMDPQPLASFYLDTDHGVIRKLIFVLSLVVGFIVLMAIINYINLNIGTAAFRLKEIGVRKVVGGLRKQIVIQFLSESLIVTFAAMIISLGLYEIFRPAMSDVFNRELISLLNFKLEFFGAMMLLAVLVALLAGAYSTFVLSSYTSVDSLRGEWKSARGSMLFRRGLITTQFFLAVFVFISSIIITRQVVYFFNKDLGYDKDHLLTVSSVPRVYTEEGRHRVEVAQKQFAKLPFIESNTLSWEIPNGNSGFTMPLYPEGKAEQDAINVTTLVTDEKYVDTYNIALVEGKFFDAHDGTWQPDNIVINETLQHFYGWDSAIGKKLKIQGSDNQFEIVGVVRDFNFASLHENQKPIIFLSTRNTNSYRFLTFRLKPGNVREQVTALTAEWHTAFPDAPFEYKFMDEQLERLYRSELQLRKAANIATVLALLIVFLGIVGLVALSITRRTKEIGIRKVLGASVPQVVILFVKEFVVLIAIANLAAWPLAYWAMSGWLSNFTERITIGIMPFVIVAGVLFCLAILIITVQSLKAATADPVKSLRYE